MNKERYKEDLSISYLRAIAAKAEINFELRRFDDDGNDVELSKKILTDDGYIFKAELGIQLKSTCSANCVSESEKYIKYKLKAKNYNDLCEPGTKKTILCLLILPEDTETWVTQNTDSLILKRCMYWYYPSEKTETENSSTVTINIPKENIVTDLFLQKMMTNIANGE